MADKRRFGRVRQLPSGRWQARYPGPDGRVRSAPKTFDRKRDAEQWLVLKESEIRRGEWLDPDAGKIPFRDYAATWVNDRVLKPRTEELYRGLLKNHLNPTFGDTDICDIKEADVRRWRKERLNAGPKSVRPFGPVVVAKGYRLIRAILNTAVDDGVIRRNPCRIKGAGMEESDERPVLSLSDLAALLEVLPRRYRALALLATFANLRWGELASLRRNDIDLAEAAVRVDEATAELDDGRLLDGTPKSRAGKRVVSFPREIVPDIKAHLAEFAQEGATGLVFIGPRGARLRRSTFRRTWVKAREAIGWPDLHFHDLRHTGNNWSAATGATIKELMARMGHSSTRAAMIYLHATAERDREIADGVGRNIVSRLHQRQTEKPTGTQGARKRKPTS